MLLEITHALEVPSAVDIPCEQEVVVLSAVPFDFPPHPREVVQFLVVRIIRDLHLYVSLCHLNV